ncbi:MAG: hypothetical protein ACR2M3_13795 [Thermomicrobiales bacterium]
MHVTMGIVIDHHVLAWISIAAILLDVLGGLYLAYDLLGGEHGPLRTLTRAVTYGLYFGLANGVCFGPAYGLAAGAGLGFLLGLEYAGIGGNAASGTRGLPLSVLLFGVLRGAVLGVAAGFGFNARFGLAFGPLAALGIVVAYLFRFSPAHDYATQARPRFRWHAVQASTARGLAIGTAAVVAGVLTDGSRGVLRGVAIGVVVTGTGVVLSTVSPFVEWWADHLPQRRLGTFGAVMLLTGLALSSLQYWVSVFDVPVR